MAAPCLTSVDRYGHLETWPLIADHILLGRKSDADIVLTDPTISRHHAEISRDAHDFFIVDLKSSYGTFVNGQPIQRYRLQDGDRIRLGQEHKEFRYVAGGNHASDASNESTGFLLEGCLRDLSSILPTESTVPSDLEKISRILDFHYYWGKSFSAQRTFEQIVKSALEISGAERGFILIRDKDQFRYKVGLDASGSVLHQSDFQACQTIVHRVAIKNKAIFMTEGIGKEYAGSESVLALRLSAVACLPLEGISLESDSPEVLGILYLDSTKQMHLMSGVDQKILAKLAQEAGNVLEKLEMIRGLEERQNVERELKLAEQTQRSLLPRSLPQFEGHRIHAYNRPTRYVGGDFYDILQLSTGELAGFLADVSGKGISAALMSSLVQGALDMEFQSASDPAEVLNRVNRLLYQKSPDDRFVTVFLFILDHQGIGKFVSAGHNPAFLYRARTAEIEELRCSGLVLGAFDFATYESCPLQLGSGDVLVIYSDGLTDAENLDGELFGEERLREIIYREAPGGSQSLESKLLSAIEDFTRGRGQTDDITFLLIYKT